MHSVVYMLQLLSFVIVATYAITTSEVMRWFRTLCMHSRFLYNLVSCAYCTGWWVSCAVAYWGFHDVWLTPLVFMVVPVTKRCMPDFLSGPTSTELSVFIALQTKKNP